MTARVSRAIDSVTPLILKDVPPRTCAQCGIDVNREPMGNERDAMLVTDGVPVGVGDVYRVKASHQTWCRACTEDVVKMAARGKRARKAEKGNRIA